jgi:hypothetical protein
MRQSGPARRVCLHHGRFLLLPPPTGQAPFLHPLDPTCHLSQLRTCTSTVYLLRMHMEKHNALWAWESSGDTARQGLRFRRGRSVARNGWGGLGVVSPSVFTVWVWPAPVSSHFPFES